MQDHCDLLGITKPQETNFNQCYQSCLNEELCKGSVFINGWQVAFEEEYQKKSHRDDAPD